MIEAPAEAGAKGAVVALIGEGVALAEIVAAAPSAAAGQPAEGARTPPAAPRLEPNRLLPAEIRLQSAIRRDVVIGGGATRGPDGQPVFTGDPKSIWTVGGVAGAAANKPLFTARRGQPVVLALVNQTGFPQPMHLHGHVCRLLHGLDDGWEPYWLDTLQVPEGKVSRIAFIADNPGKWMLGSTVLERLDTGLWTWFEVT
jgi:FtsP/CotA-like multicopper oxidase with cupredoxin domain